MAVCLHCLHADRVATRERRQRIVIRFTLWTLGLAVVGAVGAAGAGAVVRHPTRSATPAPVKRMAAIPPKTEIAATIPSMPVIPQGAPVAVQGPSPDSAKSQAARAPAGAATTPVDSALAVAAIVAIGPQLPQGRTDMPDSVFATRSGDTVVVHFDTSPLRTRRADKFERIVRQTLAAVYGPVADTLLATLPDGKLAAPNALLTALPARGIHLATPSGRKVALWPETRPGRDGPLVVAYRTIVER